MNQKACSLLRISAIFGLLSSLVVAQAADVSTRSATQNDLNLEHWNGRLEIYDIQSNQLLDLKKQLRETKNQFRTLQNRYNASHPRMLAIQGQLDVIQDEIQTTRDAIRDTTSTLSEVERSFVYDRYKTELEFEVQKLRIELARLLTRYKPRFPTVVEAKTRLETLEETLAHIQDYHREDLPDLNEGLERLHVEATLLRRNGELEQLRQRYRDKHPLVIKIKSQIKHLEDELVQLQTTEPIERRGPNRTEQDHAEEKRTVKKALLIEEIELIEEHLRNGNTPDQINASERTRMELELLELKQQLTVFEGGRVNELQLLDQQQLLLENLLKSPQSTEETFKLKRQIIEIKRDRLELSQ